LLSELPVSATDVTAFSPEILPRSARWSARGGLKPGRVALADRSKPSVGTVVRDVVRRHLSTKLVERDLDLFARIDVFEVHATRCGAHGRDPAYEVHAVAKHNALSDMKVTHLPQRFESEDDGPAVIYRQGRLNT
jgi:hypothetical protein